MNYDPIHDTYAPGSDASRVPNEELTPAAPATSDQFNTTATIQGFLPAVQESTDLKSEADPGIASNTEHESMGPPRPQASSAIPSSFGAANESSDKSDGSKLSINSLLGQVSGSQSRPDQPSDVGFPEEEEDDEDEDEDDDDEDEDDEDRDIDTERLKARRNPGELPPDFRAISRGFKHLKKADGEPFWRKDIQYDFLDELFKDETRVFTNNFPHCQVPNAANGPKLTFAELYVRTLAESSKSSRVLRERLIKDKEMGISVSKVCLLVNAGRMNTTVNFVPDMRSALRTYHSIPSLQASPDAPSRPLQDTPRLKTILKAVCDGQGHLHTLLDLLRSPPLEKPNTNVIKLIFLMSTFFQNIPYDHDESQANMTVPDHLRFVKATSGPQNRFMEFFLGDNIYPKNRARRFLWLLYTYLETSFTAEELAHNPFHPNVIPPVEFIRPEDQNSFDNDQDFEVEYATKMYHTRMMHLNEEINNTNPKRGNKSKVERQRIRKQLTSDHHYRPSNLKRLDDVADDSSVGDDTVQLEENDVTFNETTDDVNGRATYFQKFVSGSKRKKPTPSVGALVDFSRKDALVDMKWINPEFPLKDLPLIQQKYSVCTSSIRVPALTAHCETSVPRKNYVIKKSQEIVDLVSKNSPQFDQVRENVLKVLNDKLLDQCTRGNGILSIEWNNIKSDISHGIETYLYQQFGKSMATYMNDKERAEDQLLFRTPDGIRKESFMSGTEKLPGDLSPLDIGTINKYGVDFTPIEKFNSAGERTHLEFSLVQELLDEQETKLDNEQPPQKKIRFDLSKDEMKYT